MYYEKGSVQNIIFIKEDVLAHEKVIGNPVGTDTATVTCGVFLFGRRIWNTD